MRTITPRRTELFYVWSRFPDVPRGSEGRKRTFIVVIFNGLGLWIDEEFVLPNYFPLFLLLHWNILEIFLHLSTLGHVKKIFTIPRWLCNWFCYENLNHNHISKLSSQSYCTLEFRHLTREEMINWLNCKGTLYL